MDAGAEQRLRVLYLPGVPEAFERRVQLKVEHLPPLDITLTGEGVFPRICLDLPRDLCTCTGTWSTHLHLHKQMWNCF